MLYFPSLKWNFKFHCPHPQHVLIQLHKKKSSISGKALSAIGLISPQWLLFSFCSPFLNKASRFMSLCQSIIHVLWAFIHNIFTFLTQFLIFSLHHRHSISTYRKMSQVSYQGHFSCFYTYNIQFFSHTVRVHLKQYY